MHEKVTFPELTFHDVSQADADRLRAFMTKEPTGSVSDGNEGLAETSCFTAKYAYDTENLRLTIEPIHLVPGLQGQRLPRMIKSILAGHDEVDAATGLPAPTPFQCSSYNWVIGYIDNQTDVVLTYSGNQTAHGVMIYAQNKIDVGDGPTQQGAEGVFRNQSPKDSPRGCAGSISWSIDASTTLTIDYLVNTLVTKGATVVVSGENQGKYHATMDLRTGFARATSYIYPTVTFAMA